MSLPSKLKLIADGSAWSRPRWALLAVLTWLLLLGGAVLAVTSVWTPWGLLGWPMMAAAWKLVHEWDRGWRP